MLNLIPQTENKLCYKDMAEEMLSNRKPHLCSFNLRLNNSKIIDFMVTEITRWNSVTQQVEDFANTAWNPKNKRQDPKQFFYIIEDMVKKYQFGQLNLLFQTLNGVPILETLSITANKRRKYQKGS